MGNFISFAQILEGKIKKELFSQREIGPESLGAVENFDTDPAHLAFLMSQVSPLKSTKVASKSKYPAPPPRVAQPHVLDEYQKSAVEFFARWGTPLSPAFTSQELKKAFRRVAKQVHPDTSGANGSEFRELQRVRQLLANVPRR